MQFASEVRQIKFEYCSKIGTETVVKLAESCPYLRKLSVIRNFNEKSAKIDDNCIQVISECCPMLERLQIIYSRKFDGNICQLIGSGNLSKLVFLDLSYCPIQVSMEPIITGCPFLHELKLAGDSWIRKLVLHSIARHPNLRIFHLGHFEHSDIDCTHVKPQDPVFSNYSTKGIVVAETFSDPTNFPALHTLYLEKYCDLTAFLIKIISKIITDTGRPTLQFKFNENKSTLFANYGVGKDVDEFGHDKSNDSISDFDI